MKNPWIFPAVCAVILLTCVKSPQQAGTMSETDTAMIYNPDNTPAVGAVVRFFVATDSTRTVAYQATTDTNGRYSTKGLARGSYNMLATKDSLIVFQDSIAAFADTVLVKPDTLQKSGSVTAIIGVQPNHDPRTVTVQVLGTDLFSNVDINGRFTLSPVAKGNYNLRLVTTLPDYTPTYVTIHAQGQKKDTLTDTLWLTFTGIPVVTGLAASYDTVNGIVHLSWIKTAYRDFQNYLVYRDAFDSIDLSKNPFAACTDTFFADTVFRRDLASGPFSFRDTNDYHFKYRVCIENNTIKRGDTYKYVDVVAASPTIAGMFKKATSTAEFGQRYSHTSVVFNNKMWVISGYIWTGNGGEMPSYVWYSEDGISWLPAAQQPASLWMYQHTSLVFDSKMWIIGGSDGSRCLNEVWFSSDGITWTRAISTAQFPPRVCHTSVVFNNRMWVIGGYDNAYVSNDVWYSTDGITWIQATDNAGFSPRCGHSSVVFDNKMWVIGGDNMFFNNLYNTSYNDVWYSADGVTWKQATGNAGFSPRGGHSSVVFDNKMWVIAGRASLDTMAFGCYSDVWYSGFSGK
jgi:hypothetical protein